MNRRSNTQNLREILSSLIFRQVNVVNGGPNMDIALQQAWDVKAHVLSVQ